MVELGSGLITVVVTAAVTWFFQRRAYNAETKGKEFDAAKTAVDFYQNLLDDGVRRLDTAISTIAMQDEKIKMLLDQVEHLTDELKKFKQLNGKI